MLMYHYLSDPPLHSDRYRKDLSVSPALFEQHLAFLRIRAIRLSPWNNCCVT